MSVSIRQLGVGLLLCFQITACTNGGGTLDRAPADTALDWGAAQSVGTVDERFQSFNVEMVEVTGGRFWAAYGSPANEMFRYRPPFDFHDQRLRNLAGALAPAYMRISGTWANNTYFDDSPTPLSKPPKGYGAVLSAVQWDAANQFAQELNLKIVTSFAIGPGTRDAEGNWQPDNARRFLHYSVSRGYPIAAAEFANEPNTGVVAGFPKNYSAENFRSDFVTFRHLRDQEIPAMKIAGPGSASEDAPAFEKTPLKMSPSGESILAATAPQFDIVSYHFYPSSSVRCVRLGFPQTSMDAALSDDFLSATEKEAQHFKALRDRYQPGAPIWLTETAGASCGGNPWSAQFIDTFRYVEQLGRLAKQGIQVVMHNTLSASDYGLIDEFTMQPRPNYWAAVLWRQLMGTRVLDVPIANKPQGISAYAHCLRGDKDGGVALILLNRNQAQSVSVQVASNPVAQYELAAAGLTEKTVLLNGAPLSVDAQGNVPPLQPQSVKSGMVRLKPLSISFVALPHYQLQACR